jgi:hypothetical protein
MSSSLSTRSMAGSARPRRPGVPFEAVAVPGHELRARCPDEPALRRSDHLVGKLRMTHRALPSEVVIVVALDSDDGWRLAAKKPR